MDIDSFNEAVTAQIQMCERTLITKGAEYAPVDRLYNFRQAAHLEGVTVIQALSGMMAKHTVSVYDMCWDGTEHSMEKWEEKITDHINYLLLLKAVLVDIASTTSLNSEDTSTIVSRDGKFTLSVGQPQISREGRNPYA